MDDISLWDILERGGPVMWPLLAASIFAVALLLDRSVIFLWSYQTLPGAIRGLRPLIQAGMWKRALAWCGSGRGPYSRVAKIYLEHRDDPKETREDILRREGTLLLGHFENRLRWLAVLAQVSTLLGLLATFHVMIVRLHQGQSNGQAMNAEDFSAAIWEAFLTTMFGLMIAIPCSAAYQIFEGRVDRIGREMGALVSYLDEWRRDWESTMETPKREPDEQPSVSTATPTVLRN